MSNTNLSKTVMNGFQNTALGILENVDNYDIDDVIEILQVADELYHNGSESFVEDNEYDAIRLIGQQLDKTNPYFIGTGSDVRGGKVKLPFEMGSLDQVEIGDIQDWIRKNNLEDEEVVASDKMDGTSAMIIYNEKGLPQIAYSRGNGTEGADISRHIFKIANVPAKVSGKMVIRAEVELTETAFAELRSKVSRHSSKDPYKNARNMVAGLMNRKTNPAIVYKHLTVVTYEVIGFDGSKKEQLELLEDNGFQVVDNLTVIGSDCTDEFLAEYLNIRRDEIDYAIDGLVLDVNRSQKRADMNPTRDTLNPAYSIKYKVADADNMAVATVVDVEWNVSKHGYLKPRVKIEPTELVGVTVQHATGFNAKFINENGIGPGAKIRITRSGDVIPFIIGVEQKVEAKMPSEDWSWNETNVDAILNDLQDNNEVAIQQTLDFCMSIDAPHLKEGTVRTMFEQYKYDNSTDAIMEMLQLPKAEWVSAIGENGSKVWLGLKTKTAEMPLYVLMGSVPFFGRGVGKRKFKKLFKGLSVASVGEIPMLNVSQICSVDGFEEKTAKKIVNGIDTFMEFFQVIGEKVNVTFEQEKTGSMTGQKVVFTGFRDKELQTAIENAGGEMQSGVSGKTTILVAKNPNATSGKLQKARDKGVNVIGIDEIRGMV